MDLDQSASIAADFVSSDSISQPAPTETQQQTGLLSRVAGGAYNTTSTIVGGAVGGAKYVATPVVGGAAWITGAALSTSFGVAKSVSGYVLPARFRPAITKDKCE